MKRFSRLAIAAASAVFALTLGPVSVFAQFTSSVEGTVLDTSGGAVPDATVTLKEVTTGVVHTAITSSAGNYRISALPASRFNLTVEAKGFDTGVLNDISVQGTETRTVNITLKVGATTTSVTVSAEAVSEVNVSTPALSGQINETKVHELPLVGRNMYSLVVLTPGVTGTPSGGGQAYAQATADIFNAEYGVNLNANGQRADSNNFQVDSADVNGGPRGGVTNLTPNADSIQEVAVLTNNFSAEFGRNAAAIVQVVTKAGTNEFHGTLSWFYSGTSLNSRTIYQPTPPSFIRNEGAWSLGGPIRKDKDFVFGSMDFLRSSVGVANPYQIFTPQFIDYLKTNLPNNVSTQVLTQFPTTFEPNRAFNTAGSITGIDCSKLPSPGALISTVAGNMPCNLAVDGTGDFSGSVFRNGIQWSARVDHNWNDFRDHLYGSFYRTTRQTVAFATPSPYYPAFSPEEPQYTDVLNLNWTHTMGAHFVNQMTGAYTRTFGNDICTDCQVPATTINDGTATTQQNSGGFFGLFKQNNYEWKDVATLTRDRHSFKFGGNVARHHDDEYFTGNTLRPNFTFTNSLDYAADQPFSEANISIDPRTGQQAATNVDFAFRSTDLGYFFQDDFKAKPNLTLNFGLRSDLFTGPTEKFDRLNNIDFLGGATYQDLLSNAAMAHVAALWHTRFDNFAPRLGFAWDPTGKGKISIRAGWGIFYDRPAQQIYTGDRSNLPYTASANACICTPPTLPAYGLGASGQSPFNFPAVPGIMAGLDSKNGLIGAPASQDVQDPNLQTQYGENWSMSVQYEVSRGWVAEAAYLGSVGHHLYAVYDVNRFDGSLIQNQGNLVRLNTSFASFDYAQANLNSAYNGGTLAIKNRGFTKGINFQAAYTYGKAIDQQSGFGTYLPIVDPLNLQAERGLADFDVRQRLSFSVLWRLPELHNGSSRFASALLNGWQVSNITILQSGTPYSVYCDAPFSAVKSAAGQVIGNTGCDFNADGTNYDFANSPASVAAYNGKSRSQFERGIFTCNSDLCNNVFPTPGLGQEGNLGRNVFIGPGFANTDLSVIKRNKIPWFVGQEGAQLELRGEFFNAFNRVNLSGINGDLAAPSTLGTPQGTFPARDIQLGVRIQF